MIIERDQLEGQLVGRDLAPGRPGNRGGEPLVVERGRTRSLRGVDDDEFTGSGCKVVAVPEARVVVEPVGYDLVLEDEPGAEPLVDRAAGARTTGRLQEARGRCPQIRLRERQCPRHGQQRVGMLGAEPG